MKAYTDLTYLGQVRRLGRLGKAALKQYGCQDALVRLINHGENTTYQVRFPEGSLPKAASPAYAENTCLLRIHRTGYNNQASIASELMWLTALREAGHSVPEPVPAQDGTLFVQVATPEMPDGRVCSLLRWMQGKFYAEVATAKHYSLLGQVMAQLHQHAQTWQPPAAFKRRRWDWEGLFGEQAGFNLPAEDVWGLIPDVYRAQFQTIAAQTRHNMHALGETPETFGLIHADLHLWNVIFNDIDGNLQAYPLDFDDCGYAHWVYDFAAALGDETEDEDWRDHRDALFDGYTKIQPLPKGVEEHLEVFIAARIVSLMLWAADMSTVNPAVKESLPAWFEWSEACLSNLDRVMA